MKTLEIKNLHVKVGDLEILKGIDLTVKTGELHALLGPNGHGKSTLLGAIMGNPKYTISEGSITLDGEDVLAMSVDERAKAGLFLAMQYPMEISGVTISDFMKEAINVRNEKPISLYKFIKELENATKEVGLPLDMVHRFINEGFSGGEKKRNEVLQMMLLKPSFALLDEIDSGLDVDALKIITDVINRMRNDDFGCLVVSHYARMYSLISPTHVHVVINGKIVVSGDNSIITKIDNQGYEWIKDEYGIEVSKASNEEVVRSAPLSLGACAANTSKKGS
jgi:Fe-S cluster assembly ATP-binding protein